MNLFSSSGSDRQSDVREFGKVCTFFSRLCGTIASVLILICGLISLLPLPSLTTSLSDYPRCLGVAFIFILSSVVMFFMEASIVAHCSEKLTFIIKVSKYIKNWHRSVAYIGVSIAPIVLWCLSTSTIIPMILMFLVGVLYFVLTIGQKGDHSANVAARWQKVGEEEMQSIKDEENSEETIELTPQSTL